MEKIIIAAVAENGVIGKDGDLPWHYPEDMKHFRELTTGNPVVMGRKTFESLPEDYRPLPDRKNIVLTRSGVDEDVHEASSLEEAWEIASEDSDRVFIAGGASVYESTLEEADRMELTRIHEEYDGDTCLPEFDGSEWEEVARDDHEDLSFISYRRREK
jgi:dihydrofolate reductase